MKVSWVFDFISPFSYLCLKRLSELPAGTEIEYVPVLFPGILNHFGQIGNAEIPSKRRFTYRFVLWQARKAGIPMRMPPAHPFNPIPALRFVLAAGGGRAAIETIFDAIWRDGRDPGDPAVLADLGKSLGIGDVQAAMNDPAVKQRLRENTEWAVSKGVFGVPTFVIGDHLFWGNDALEMVSDYLRDPEGFMDAEMRRADELPVGAKRRAPAPS